MLDALVAIVFVARGAMVYDIVPDDLRASIAFSNHLFEFIWVFSDAHQ